MTARLSTSSNGGESALTAVIADWAARNPKIQRVWACEAPVPQAVAVALELQSRLRLSRPQKAYAPAQLSRTELERLLFEAARRRAVQARRSALA